MMASLRDFLWLAVGLVFVVTLIPPVLIVGAVAMLSGRLERK